MQAPFRQRPFTALPEHPRVPHRFFETRGVEVTLDTPHWGPHTAHYRVHGEGPPLLLVHGLMTASYSWRYTLEPLGSHFTLYMPDLVGAGRSAKIDRAYHPDHLADWIGAFGRAVGIRGCPVIGNSLGGYLAMRLALRDPEAMSRLVNLHSPGTPLARLYALRFAMGLPVSQTLLRWLVHRDPERWVHRNVHYYDESLKSLEEAREYAEPLRSASGVAAFGRTLRETLDPSAMKDFVATLRARRDAGKPFPVPLLLLYADRDPVVPPRVGERLAALVPDATHRTLHRASHFAHVDAVERFLPPVLDFLT